MALTLADLREFINDSEELDGGTEVAIAVQPSWPFQHSIEQEIYTVTDENGERPIIFFAEAGQTCYLPGNVAREIGWR